MNVERNQFEELPEIFREKGLDRSKWIPFDLREVVEVKGYRFRISAVSIAENRLVLEPLGPALAKTRPTIEELQKILDEPNDEKEVYINEDGSISAK